MAKKKHEEHENHERWLVSYADFITMLFAFFTMLYANAPKDDQKIQQIIQGIKDAFGGGARVDIVEVLDLMNLATENPVEAEAELQRVYLNPEINAMPEVPIPKVGTDGSLTDNLVELGMTEQDLILIMPEKFLFPPGSAELPVAAFGWLSGIAEAIRGTAADIQVVGHADGAPIPGNARYQDNWSLASARAAEAVRYLESKGVKPNQMVLMGKVVDGVDPEQRAITIRIHIIDLPAASEVRQRLEDQGIGRTP